MISLTDRIEGDLGKAMSTTKDFIKSVVDAIGGYSADDSANAEKKDTKLVSTLRAVEEDFIHLSRTRSALHRAIADFSLYTRGNS